MCWPKLDTIQSLNFIIFIHHYPQDTLSAHVGISFTQRAVLRFSLRRATLYTDGGEIWRGGVDRLTDRQTW